MALLTREQRAALWRRTLSRRPGMRGTEVSEAYEVAVQAVEDALPDLRTLISDRIDQATQALTPPVTLPPAAKRAIAETVLLERIQNDG